MKTAEANLQRRITSAALVLVVSQIASQGLSFLRNLLLARYLAKADYGLASAFALSVALLEVIGRMALGQQVVQARDGGTDVFQRNAQSFQLCAGVLSALLLVIASGSLARILHVPDRSWAFILLALIPLCMGLEHLDVYRFQRELRFMRGVFCELGPQLVVTCAIWPLITWLRDYRVILWLIIGKTMLSTGCTHIFAERSYRLAWSPDVAHRIFSFSWPLLVNGVLVFASQQADQLIVGARFSLEQLAHYSVVASILMALWSIFARASGPVMMAMLSGFQERRIVFMNKCQLYLEFSAIVTVMLTLPLIVSGEQIVVALFGDKYIGVSRFMVILAAASAFRFLRSGPTTAAMALGDTKNQMWSNVARSVSLPLVVIVVCFGCGIEAVAACAVIGEMAALTTSYTLMSTRHRIPVGVLLKPVVFTAVCLLGSCAVFLSGAPRWSMLVSVLGALALASVSLGLAWCLFPGLREQIQGRLNGRMAVADAVL